MSTSNSLGGDNTIMSRVVQQCTLSDSNHGSGIHCKLIIDDQSPHGSGQQYPVVI